MTPRTSCVSVYLRPLPRHGQLFWRGRWQLLVRAGSQWRCSSRPGRCSQVLQSSEWTCDCSTVNIMQRHFDIEISDVHPRLCSRIFMMKMMRSGSPRNPGGKWSEPPPWLELVASSPIIDSETNFRPVFAAVQAFKPNHTHHVPFVQAIRAMWTSM